MPTGRGPPRPHAGEAAPAVLLIVRLLLAESSVEVAVSGPEIRALLDAEDDRMYGGRVALNHLLGWTALRSRESPDLAIEYFSAAAREAQEAGDRELTSRAVGHLAYGLATSGRLTEAATVLAEAESTRETLLPRNTFARGSAMAAAGGSRTGPARRRRRSGSSTRHGRKPHPAATSPGMHA